MVACPKCVVNNTLDSAFCKKCGAVLPISIIEEEQEKLKEIVTKGMESFQTGNLEEAMMVAEHAILTNPSYGEAYALKGLVHERNGAYAEALDSYETVVALNPDSTMDKIKLNQLRNAFATRQAGEPKIDRKGAALMAVGVAVACLAIVGISYGIISSSKETKPGLTSNVAVQSNAGLLANRANNSGQPGLNIDPNRRNPAPGDEPALGSDKNPPINSRPQTDSTNRMQGMTTNFTGDGTDEPAGVDVSTPRGNIDRSPGKTLPRGDKPKPIKEPPNDPVVTDQGDKGVDPPVKAETSTMVVEVSHRGGDAASPSKGTSVSGSSSQGKAYQRQAQQNQRSGKTAQARDAYQKAIDAYQKEIDSGKGDKDAATAGINSSKQALKNLKD